MDLHGFTWNMGLHGFTWVYMGLHGTWVYMKHGFTWVYMSLHRFTWVYMGLHGFTWNGPVLKLLRTKVGLVIFCLCSSICLDVVFLRYNRWSSALIRFDLIGWLLGLGQHILTAYGRCGDCIDHRECNELDIVCMRGYGVGLGFHGRHCRGSCWRVTCWS